MSEVEVRKTEIPAISPIVAVELVGGYSRCKSVTYRWFGIDEVIQVSCAHGAIRLIEDGPERAKEVWGSGMRKIACVIASEEME
ncbi:hypothetical protein ABH922_004888 [Rhodococcus sp. 27YEA15]